MAWVLMYVGDIQFVILVLYIFLMKFKSSNFCCFGQSAMKRLQQLDWKLPWFSYNYREFMFVDSLIEHIGVPNYVYNWVWDI